MQEKNTSILNPLNKLENVDISIYLVKKLLSLRFDHHFLLLSNNNHTVLKNNQVKKKYVPFIDYYIYLFCKARPYLLSEKNLFLKFIKKDPYS